MVLEKLSDNLKATLRKVTGASFVDEKLINEIVKDIQRSLLQADVNVKLVFQVAQAIKERALKEKAPKGISAKENLVNIVYEELVRFVGGEHEGIQLTEKPFIIMLVGLFGNGKTTTAGKLAKYYKKRGKRVALLSTDTWRPAAAQQLAQLAEQVGVQAYIAPEEKDPEKIFKKFEGEFNKYDLVIVDTAGRDALNEELITELNTLNRTVKANETLLVMSADIGQSAEKQAKTFHETCNVNGVIITKLDGTAKGGGALIACAITGAPVKFIGVGEKIDDFEEFRPQGFVGRLLGMGDLESLLEKTQEAISEEDAEDLGRRFMKGDFTLIDLYEQMRAMKKMGPLNKVMGMIPGMGGMNIPKEALDMQEGKIDDWRVLMDSMTKQELENPDVMNPGRIERIAKGSGKSRGAVRELLKQYKQSKKMVKMMKGMSGDEKDMQKMMTKMQKSGLGKKLRHR